jgi:hypothetical protein
MESSPAVGQERALKPHFTVFQPISQVNADLIQKILTILHGMALLHLTLDVRLTSFKGVEAGTTTLEEAFRPWSRRVPLGDVFNECNWLLRDQSVDRLYSGQRH